MKVRDLIAHLRLKFQFVFFFVFLIGFFLGGYKDIAKFLFGAFIWLILLSGGTVAYNSYYDKDEGPISMLKNPPKSGKDLLVFSIAILVIGLLLSYLVNLKFFVAYVLSFILAVLYSYPKIRLKTKYGIDLLINGFGYGSLTLLAGWLTSTEVINITAIAATVVAFFFIAAGLPLTQVFQYEQDKKKGDKTFTVRLGIKKSLLSSFILFLIGLILLILSAVMGYFELFPVLITSLVLIYTLFFIFKWYKNYKNLDHSKQLYKSYGFVVMAVVAFIISHLILRQFP